MKLRKTLRLSFWGVLLLHSACLAMTTELGSGGGDIISVGETWRFLPGTEAPSMPENAWTGELWPHGKQINMGTYGGTAQASLSSMLAGNAADCNNDGVVNADDLKLLAEQWLREKMPHRADVNRDQRVDFQDLAELSQNWHWKE